MKTKFFLSLLMVVLLASCGKKESNSTKEAAEISAEKTKPEKFFITISPVKVGETGVVLPVGTKVYVAADEYSIDAELPKGYSYLTEIRYGKTIPATSVATYRCDCSATIGTGCKVFYQEQAGGFGCIHSTCTGSCTGKFTSKENGVAGVINLLNTDVDARKSDPVETTKLTPEGRKEFFAIPEVQEKIKEQYEFLYKNLTAPDFDAIEKNPSLLKNYVYAAVHLYGVSFYMLAPRELMKYKNSLNLFDAVKAHCDCDDSNSCTLKNMGLLGFKVYWCEGTCSSCALTIN